ncbi:protein PHOSPHATE STARVATION RESPONSE 3-like [Pistacia vera]|uniref:protein PHOSPHATE STARVATION RESPONSE 3-like n=1 Tax=Pistacia vera TaxID=55513 RepID=UPI001262FB0B|nr:protein PHOSPHATE STARVATION RESPONSE 3-like [Pistacia vera]
MQIEAQKLLHEQLKVGSSSLVELVQKELQLRIEKQGEQLRKIMEEQEKAGSSLFPINGLFSCINSMTEAEQSIPCSFPGTSADQVESNTESSSLPKHKTSAANEYQPSRNQKRPREE